MGIDFHNTGYGKRFFEHQLPMLIAEVAGLRSGVADLVRVLGERPAGAARRTVLLVSRNEPFLRALHRALRGEHEVHVARSRALAEELLDLHAVDTVVADAETLEALPGPPLFGSALRRGKQPLCVALSNAPVEEHAALKRRLAAHVVLDNSEFDDLVPALRAYLR